MSHQGNLYDKKVIKSTFGILSFLAFLECNTSFGISLLNKVVMGFDSNIFSMLKAPGLLTAVLAVDVAIVLMAICFIMYVVSPTVEMYKRSKALDELAGPTKRHWIYGHNKEVS